MSIWEPRRSPGFARAVEMFTTVLPADALVHRADAHGLAAAGNDREGSLASQVHPARRCCGAVEFLQRDGGGGVTDVFHDEVKGAKALIGRLGIASDHRRVTSERNER